MNAALYILSSSCGSQASASVVVGFHSQYPTNSKNLIMMENVNFNMAEIVV